MIHLLQLHTLLLHNLPKFPVDKSKLLRYSYIQYCNLQQFLTFTSISVDGSPDFFDGLLQDSAVRLDGNHKLEQSVKQIHAQIILRSSFSEFLSARLIMFYSKVSLLDDARKVFDACSKDSFSSSLIWNSMIRANMSCLRYKNALAIYKKMRDLDLHPDGFGFPLILRAFSMAADARLCQACHCHVIQVGLSYHLHVCNDLMLMYAAIGCMEVALRVFDRMPLRSRVSWNIMISGFGKNCDCDGAVEMFHRMENEGVEPNSVTWTSLISAFARCGLSNKTWEFYALMREKGVNATAESIAVVASVCFEMPTRGALVHVHVIKGGYEEYVYVKNALMTMYGRSGDIQKAKYLFSELKSQTLISWNALISIYAQWGMCDEASSALMKLNNLGPSLKPNVVSWSAVISGFSTCGRNEETLELFRVMQYTQVLANAVTIACVLSACADLSSLPLGREIHAHCIRMLMDCDTLVKNGLTNMYMKCGNLRTGQLLFERMIFRHISSWNIMITGYGMHGMGKMALEIFHQMVNGGVKPDKVSFVAAISACSHSGLIAEGQELFETMLLNFEIEPEMEHYACMVDLYSRAGYQQKAHMILKSMPMEPNAAVWGALMNSCETVDAKMTASQIFDMDSGASGYYMSLSNLYAANGRWDESARVRISARENGVKKLRGESLVLVKKKLYSFSAGDAFNKAEMEELEPALQALHLHSLMESQDMNEFS